MAQNIVTLFGANGSLNYLALLKRLDRYPVLSVQALNEDGTLLADITNDVSSYQLSYADSVGAQQCSLQIANPAAKYDKYGGSTTLIENRLLNVRLGLQDPVNGYVWLLPGMVTRISKVTPNYQKGQNEVLTVTALDLLKNPVKQKATTNGYVNSQVNAIAADILKRYAKITNLDLDSVNYMYPFVQFPDMSIVDMLTDLFRPLLFYVRMDEKGYVSTGPRLGSFGSSFGTLLGYPDSTSAPAPSLVSYIFPDASLISVIGEEWGDMNFVNQVRVLGQAQAAVTTLGAIQQLYVQNDSTAGMGSSITVNIPFSQGGAGQNQVLADHVQVLLNYSTDHHLDDSPRTITLGDGADGHIDVYNETNQLVGNFSVQSITPTNIILKISGYQFTGGSGEHHGGFDYNFVIQGRPRVSYERTITSIRDYNAVAFTNTFPATGPAPIEGTGNIFGDNQTYQLSQSPLSQQFPVVLIASNLGPQLGLSQVGTLPPTTTTVLAAGPTIMDSDSRPYVAISETGISSFPTDGAFSITNGTTTEYMTFGDEETISGDQYMYLDSPLINAYGAGATVEFVTGVVSADGQNLSDIFQVDFDQGRIVLATNEYRTYSEDDTASHPLSETVPLPPPPTTPSQVGHTTTYAESDVYTYNLDALQVPTPQAVYQTNRQGDTRYIFTGLTADVPYNLTLHFAEFQPLQGSSSSSSGTASVGSRVFSVYVNEIVTLPDFDIFVASGGTRRAIQQIVNGILPDTSGNITIDVTQFDPLSGLVLPGSVANGDTVHGPLLNRALICGIEVTPPAGGGASPYSVNCGGPAINPVIPDFFVSAGYSAIQAQYGVISREINDPLLGTQSICDEAAEYELQYSAWARNPISIVTVSVPHIQVGDLIQFYHPRLNSDMWAYIYALDRKGQRDGGGRVQSANANTDTYKTYLLYVQPRT